jgi:hypothetical protein
MPDKKNEELNEAEMQKAAGGGIEARQTRLRDGMEDNARGVIEDPLGPPTQTGDPSGMGGEVKP